MANKEKSVFTHFITAENGMLMDGAKPFRFISFNVPNLNYIEDDMRFEQANPYRLPNEFEIRDVLATVREIGGRVVRLYTIPVKSIGFPAEAPFYVLGPGKFNEEAFRCLDLALALAGEYGVRVILPLVNNWQWMGGRQSYAAFRDLGPNEFWTDKRLIGDFKAMIQFLLTRTNSMTGVKYKDDKSIMCWETGNQLFAPHEWTIEIARFIKSIDPNHLVMDGGRGDFSNQLPSIMPASLDEASIDIVTTHHSEIDGTAFFRHIEDNIRAIAGRKAYIIGELGFAAPEAVEAALNLVISKARDIAGALIWSLRGHSRDGGFYWHTEPFGDAYKALHWPGFPSGQLYDEARMMVTAFRKAHEIRGMAPPAVSVPAAPTLLPIESPAAISWQGSMGAASYVIERATSQGGPWERIGPNVGDADIPYFPLFNDTNALIGNRYYYRVRAVNSSGMSPPSNVVGPVQAEFKVKLDTMKNLDEAVFSNMVTSVTGNDRSYKEIRNRLAGRPGSDLAYSVPGRFKSLTVYAFEHTVQGSLQIFVSEDGHVWHDLKVKPTSYTSSEIIYDYRRPKIYRCGVKGKQPVQFVKIKFKNVAQLARVAIVYANR